MVSELYQGQAQAPTRETIRHTAGSVKDIRMIILHNLDHGLPAEVVSDTQSSSTWGEFVCRRMRMQGFCATRSRDASAARKILKIYGMQCADSYQLQRFLAAYHRMFIPNLQLQEAAQATNASIAPGSSTSLQAKQHFPCDSQIASLHENIIRHLSAQRALWGWMGYLESAHQRLEALLVGQDVVQLQAYVDLYCKEMKLEQEQKELVAMEKKGESAAQPKTDAAEKAFEGFS